MLKVIIFILCSFLVIGCNPGEETSNSTDSTESTSSTDSTDANTAENQPTIEPVIEIVAWGNAKCPVMPEDDVDMEISTTYQGKTLHFCCKKCVTKFNENPEKYHEALMAMTKE